MAISMNSLRMGCTAVAAVAMLSLGGCGSIGVALGWRTRLDKLPVTAVSATLSPSPGLSPGKSGRLIIVATGADNQQWTSVGPGHGKVLFDSFTFDSTVVQVNKRGVVSLPSDPRVSSGKTAHIHVAVPRPVPLPHPGHGGCLEGSRSAFGVSAAVILTAG
jgi:hypothetical protein